MKYIILVITWSFFEYPQIMYIVECKLFIRHGESRNLWRLENLRMSIWHCYIFFNFTLYWILTFLRTNDEEYWVQSAGIVLLHVNARPHTVASNIFTVYPIHLRYNRFKESRPSRLNNKIRFSNNINCSQVGNFNVLTNH